ncbi:hypothetical protein SERLA73DRAFT_166772 [Serpula lacrymans var. lacrymans S7.3]|uniref:UBA domain-containing protein n=1 Tax=Serpula lacrymans var. lacrymans (strain S7.3) TaxID=936435 RepID=F8PQX4_SERL3|nr:hypothetical protein SERLA73DRAFT_166772 [Serpula lacrymans var. lacrymans S7.3]
MSDSFADLWNSSAPTKPTQPQKLGAISPQNTNPRRPQNDVFSLLASSGSQPSSRIQSPAVSSPAQSNRSVQATQATNASKSNGDAFSGLLSGSLGKGLGNGGANMTIAERAAMVERAKSQQYQRTINAAQSQRQSHSSTWAGIDSLATPVHNDDWDLGGLSSPQPTTKPPTRSQPSQSIWDIDDFTSESVSPLQAPAHKFLSRSDSPGDFDFGNREDGLLDNDSDHGDDILGDLSKPIDKVAKNIYSHDHSNRATPSPRPLTSGQSSRPVSPPPHIIGQIVEMGFSPQQARVALAATDTGLDVQAALETLLSNGAGSEPPSNRRPVPGARTRPQAHAQRPRETSSPSESQQQDGDLKEQADKLIAQANEIGISLFNRANALWKDGKEKAQKLYEERAAAAKGASSPQAQDGRPRWMQEASFRDDDDDDDDSRRRDREGASADVLPPKPSRRPNVEPSRQPQPKENDLLSLSVDAPVAYKSPFRRGRPKAEIVQSGPSSVPARAPSPIQLVQRQTVSASLSAITASNKHKLTGTEKYKLGQYADAEIAYSAAIAALPHSHLLLVPLYNNRALTRLKTGNHTAAVDDCSAVIKIIGVSYHPAREAKVVREEDGSGADLADGLVKAWKRRAEAYEGREKWELAQKDWESVAGAEWAAANVRNEAVRGAGRCRKMASASSEAGASSAPPKPRPPPVQRKPPALSRRPSPPSQALNKLREANDAADAEDQARHELKDSVDGRLLAWKGGKETNIRALVASLDNVLWPELGWQKVGMADLVSPSQVKIRYTKAIAKLHPDKLNVNNTTLEQRMIANGVFGALNEAWNAFKQ